MIQGNTFWLLELPEYVQRNPILVAHFEKVHQYVLKHAKPWHKTWLQPPSPEELGEFEQPKVEEIIESHKKSEVQRLIDESRFFVSKKKAMLSSSIRLSLGMS